MSELASTPGAALPAHGTNPLATELARVWPDHDRAIGGPALLLAGVAGLAAAVLVVDNPPGLGLLLTGLAIGATALSAARHRLGVHEICFAAPGVLLLAGVAVRDSPWFVALCLLGAAGIASYALAPGRTLFGTFMGGASLPLAALRCLPWLRRGLQPRATSLAGTWPAVRSLALTGVLLLVFGSLFAGADAAFASFIPRPDLGLLPARFAVAVVISGVAVSAAFLGAAPPRWDVLAPGRARPVRMAEWLMPIAMLDALFLTFVTVQLTVLFGGHRHVLETAGLTYAEYARGGFGQLLVVTLLTLSVVAATVRWAPRQTRAQRTALRLLLGVLCALTLVIVASALYRLHLYEEAFGFTRLRLFMNAFETWLGGLVALVLIAGVRLRATWLARAVVATAAAMLLALGAVKPGRIRRRAQRRSLPIDRQARRRLPAAALGRRCTSGRRAARTDAFLRAGRDARHGGLGRVRRRPRRLELRAITSGRPAQVASGAHARHVPGGLTSAKRDISWIQTRYIVT